MLQSKKIRNIFTMIVLISMVSFFSCTSIKTDFVTKSYTEQVTIYKHGSDDPQADTMIPEKTSVTRYALEMQQTKYLDVPKTLGLVGLIGLGSVVVVVAIAQIWVIDTILPW
jgi:hypothetical protein